MIQKQFLRSMLLTLVVFLPYCTCMMAGTNALVPVAPQQTQRAWLEPFKLLSRRSLLVGGTGLATGTLAVGLWAWRKKLERELSLVRNSLADAKENSLERFLVEHQILSLQQDIQSLKKYSKALLVAAGIIGVGTVGSVGFDVGRATGTKEVSPGATQQVQVMRRELTSNDPDGAAAPQVLQLVMPSSVVTEHDILATQLVREAGTDVPTRVAVQFELAPTMNPLQKAIRNYEFAKKLYGVQQSRQAERLLIRAQAILESFLGINLGEKEQEAQIIRDANRYIQKIQQLNKELNALYGYTVVPESREAIIVYLLEQVSPPGAGVGAGGGRTAYGVLSGLLPNPQVLEAERTLLKWQDDRELLAHRRKALPELAAILDHLPQELHAKYQERVDDRLRLVTALDRLPHVTEDKKRQAREALQAFGSASANYTFWDRWQDIEPLSRLLADGDSAQEQIGALAEELAEHYESLIDEFITFWLAHADGQVQASIKAIAHMNNAVQHLEDKHFPYALRIKEYFNRKKGTERTPAGKTLDALKEEHDRIPHRLTTLEHSLVTVDASGNAVPMDLRTYRGKEAVLKQLAEIGASLQQQRRDDGEELKKRIHTIYDRFIWQKKPAFEKVSPHNNVWLRSLIALHKELAWLEMRSGGPLSPPGQQDFYAAYLRSCIAQLEEARSAGDTDDEQKQRGALARRVYELYKDHSHASDDEEYQTALGDIHAQIAAFDSNDTRFIEMLRSILPAAPGDATALETA